MVAVRTAPEAMSDQATWQLPMRTARARSSGAQVRRCGPKTTMPPTMERLVSLPVEARLGLALVGLLWASGLWKLRRRLSQHDAPSSNQVR